MRQGDKGADVKALQSILTQAGYLGLNREPGVLCTTTMDAIRHFQSNYGLEETGIGDQETLALLQLPRCGVPDFDEPDEDSVLAPFSLRGCKYDDLNLTYAILNDTPDMSQVRQREIIMEAFDAWAAVSRLSFTEVQPSDSPTFTLSFESGNHGDGSSFDGAGNTLAHAFYPPPCGGTHSGACHFDEAEGWTDQSASGRFRLLNVAIHEIGHLLGLEHSSDQNAIMFASYNDGVDRLGSDDVAGIQQLYGAPAGNLVSRATGQSDDTVEIVLRNGRRVFAPQNISTAALERIIRSAEHS